MPSFLHPVADGDCLRYLLVLSGATELCWGRSSIEIWDAEVGQWLSRCRSQPFDVHAAWMPDGKHFVAGLDARVDPK